MNTKGKRRGRPYIKLPSPASAETSVTPAPEPSIPLSFRLPKSLAEDLDRFDHARGDHRRLSDRARERLARSLFDDRQREKDKELYEKLYELFNQIKEIADIVKYQCDGAEWYADQTANTTFAAAVAHEIFSYDASSLWHKAKVLAAALMQPEADASGRVIAKEVRRRTREPAKGEIFGPPRPG